MDNTRIAVINKKRCAPKRCAHECLNFCPRVRAGADTVKIDNKFAEIAEDLCIGCGICAKKCPFGAISIINLSLNFGNVVHQYGKNTFRLYNIPMPRKGEIVGLIGENAIGKTTTIDLFSGKLIPNMGNLNEKKNRNEKYDDLIKTYKASSLHNYFLDVKKSKIKVAYKPQKIDRIISIFKKKETVADIIEKSGAKKDKVVAMLNDINEKENDENFLKKKAMHLSGGEMQKLAIAITLCKNRDVYFFDEPSLYLDIYNRLSMARHIKKLKEKKVYCFVVEHDLAIVDYMCDYIHMYFGKQGVYGAVSDPYTQNQGINTYLSGYLKEKNIRFRNKAISFDFTSQKYSSLKKVLVYPSFSKKYPDFQLKCSGGTLYAGEVVGIFGANALGKTTFAKVLAGVEKSDSDKIKLRTKISYKPQYLESIFKKKVIDIIHSSECQMNEFLEISKHLRIEDMSQRYISTLSGGELQRLAIAICLSRKAEVYLLDEPSAYLDVEERVRLSKIIRDTTQLNQKSTLVIDHDMIFLNYTADKSILFNGISGKSGFAEKPKNLYTGFNQFLKELNITFRLDKDTKRPRSNKENSQRDVMQKEKGEYLSLN